MGTLSDLDLELQTISEIIGEPEKSPEHRLGMAVHLAFSALDEIVAMAANPETKNLVNRERIMVGQLVSRAELIASFILSTKPGQFKVVRNNG